MVEACVRSGFQDEKLIKNFVQALVGEERSRRAGNG